MNIIEIKYISDWIKKKCLNVRQKLGTWKFFNVFLRFPMLLTLILTLSHYLTLSHSHTHSISHSITLDMLNNFCFHLYAQNSLSHSHTLTLSLSHTLSLSLSHSLNLSFNHSWHAEQVLFSCLGSKVAVYSRKLQWFFLDLLLPWVLSS